MAIARQAGLAIGEMAGYKDRPDRIFLSAEKGVELGYYRLGFDASKKVVLETRKSFILDEKTTSDPEIQALIDKEFPPEQ